jgi:hypothetical protein
MPTPEWELFAFRDRPIDCLEFNYRILAESLADSKHVTTMFAFGFTSLQSIIFSLRKRGVKWRIEHIEVIEKRSSRSLRIERSFARRRLYKHVYKKENKNAKNMRRLPG